MHVGALFFKKLLEVRNFYNYSESIGCIRLHQILKHIFHEAVTALKHEMFTFAHIISYNISYQDENAKIITKKDMSRSNNGINMLMYYGADREDNSNFHCKHSRNIKRQVRIPDGRGRRTL